MSSATFELVWTRAGLDEAPHDATLKPAVATGDPVDTLPRLTLGEPVVGEAPAADLQLAAVLGQGGMGVVWLARQASLDRDVAIKRVRPDAPPGAARALLREARVLGALEHPNIVPVHALGVDADGVPVLVMKRVEGVEWRAIVKAADHPWWTERHQGDRLGRHVEILIAVCRAVELAHARGIVHRDLKPENVMIGRFGEVYVMDWGVARRLDGQPRRHVVGTPAYMAPELLDLTVPLSPATDVYLLGGCLHEVLTGRPPHAGATLEEVMRSVHASDPPALGPEVPAAVARIVRRACARAPGDRYGSVGELREALEDYLRHRHALALAEAARTRLDALRIAVREGAPADALFTECRFAFRQSLEAHADNPDARDGLVEAIRLVIPAHLARGDAEGAQALADELAALGEDATRWRDEAARALRERQELLDLRRDVDPTVSAGPRALGVGALAAMFLVVAIGVMVRPDAYTREGAFWLMVASHGAAWTLLALGRRRVLANAAGRQLAGVLVALGVAGITNRALALRLETSIASMLATDAMLLAAAAAAAAMVAPRLGWAALPFAATIAAIVVAPQHALVVFAIGGTVGCVVSAALLAAVWRSG